MIKRFTNGFLFTFLMVLSYGIVVAQSPLLETNYVSTEKGKGNFKLAADGQAAPLFLSSGDFPGVLKIAANLKKDITSVTSATPEVLIDQLPKLKEVVLIGTLGKNPVIDQLVRENKLDVSDIQGKWDTYLVTVVDKPVKGVGKALVIVGSNKRGTIYGMYDLSRQIGVSPLEYWADVPPKKKDKVYIIPGRHSAGEPKVKYRGLFINDEAPALTGWVREKFGGFNSQFYDHVFNLILRLRGNYLWPAMWNPRMFNVEDPLNPVLADEYGIVMGTSHHEPMMRSDAEWEPSNPEQGPWNYETNEARLKEFFRGGIERMGNKESIVTVAMRGEGDVAMSRETNTALLEKIVADQRKIIEEVTGKPASETPQLWALYKEVQEYYDQGMRVPDDITLLLCDDNWGNIRKLPEPTETRRSGGYGIYYHFDYVGGPRNYKWINTSQISRVWEQMHLAYEHGVDRIWIVNVGDIKPMEFPITFWFDYAWNPDNWPLERVGDYTRLWAEEQFGTTYAKDIADILEKYTRYNATRKPELLNWPNENAYPFSLTNFQEAEKRVDDFNMIAEKAEKIYNQIPAEYKDAFYQLVYYPTVASANVNELWYADALNAYYARQGRASTNKYAEKVKELFARDAELADFYNTKLAGGKWNHQMDQANIGYRSWQEPRNGDQMPSLNEVEVPEAASMGVSVDGSNLVWPAEGAEAPELEYNVFTQAARYIDVFNKGKTPFEFTVTSGKAWVEVWYAGGLLEKDERIFVTVDWPSAPEGVNTVPVTVMGNGQTVVINVIVNKPSNHNDVRGFIESDGYVSMLAENFSKAVNGNGIEWKTIPGLGRRSGSVTTFPASAPAQTPGGDSPHLEYNMYIYNPGTVKVKAFLAPPLDIYAKGGVRYAVSVDDQTPKIVEIFLHPDKTGREWNQTVADYAHVSETELEISGVGEHTLKFWMIDTGIVLQNLLIETTGEAPRSYLGPPESFRK